MCYYTLSIVDSKISFPEKLNILYMLFRFWFKGEPNDSNRAEDCIELNYKRENDRLNSWNDRRCSDKIKGVCEK